LAFSAAFADVVAVVSGGFFSIVKEFYVSKPLLAFMSVIDYV
jgi:hypothetical protein